MFPFRQNFGWLCLIGLETEIGTFILWQELNQLSVILRMGESQNVANSHLQKKTCIFQQMQIMLD